MKAFKVLRLRNNLLYKKCFNYLQFKNNFKFFCDGEGKSKLTENEVSVIEHNEQTQIEKRKVDNNRIADFKLQEKSSKIGEEINQVKNSIKF
jgi:hypothetical protein